MNSPAERFAAKIAALPTAQLRAVIAGLYSDTRPAAAIAFNLALVELEGRIPESDFVDFCDSF